MRKKLRMLSLCAGIGAIDLAAEWTGQIEVVGQVEKDGFCQKVLAKHWPNVKRMEDLKEIADDQSIAETINAFGAVDLIAGGVPCQPFSRSGKRRGISDDRHLWPYAFRLVQAFRPRWVVIENVDDYIDMAFDLVASDLESEKYQIGAYVLPASSVQAPHKRDRAFIVAYTNGKRCQEQHSPTSIWQSRLTPWRTRSPGSEGELEPRILRDAHGSPYWVDRPRYPVLPSERQPADEPSRVIERKIKHRNERLKALGNAVVPAQIYPIFAGIVEIEQMMQEA